MSKVVDISGAIQHSCDWPQQVDGHIIRIEQRLNQDDSRWKGVVKGFDTAREWIIELETRIEKLEKKKWWKLW